MPVPTLDVLLPIERAGQRIAPHDDAALNALYEHPDPGPGGGAHVRANMIATLDGAATGPDRVSGSINNPADHRAFEAQRGWADVVLIGAGTARAEGYLALAVPAASSDDRAARGQRPGLELAVVSAHGALPAGLLDGPRPPLVVTIADRPDLDSLRGRIGPDRVLIAGTGAVDLHQAIAGLAHRGLRRVLTEGGPRLLAQLVARGLVDELCLTASPMLVAGGAPRVLASEHWITPAVEARSVHLLHSGGVLLGRWLLSGREDPLLGSQP